MTRNRRYLVRRSVSALLALLVSATVLGGLTETASATAPQATTTATPALSGSSFQAGNIISDYAFFNKNALTQVDIQTFLDAECPTHNCIDHDTFYSADESPNAECPGGYTGVNATEKAPNGTTVETAAAIIYKIEQSCGISAKVILVTLQKEQSLVTTQLPSSGRLNAAMGYNCPDSAPCSTANAGFFRQIYDAAWQFQEYRINAPNSSIDPVGQVKAILTSPVPKCPTINVKIANEATRGLYIYTPYTPDAPALANLTGVGDTCSSYGNRNFWVYYNEWFGSPTTTVPPGVAVSRIGGADRYAVAVGLSQKFAPGVPVVYISDGTNFPDALSAGASAAKQGGPLLLVAPTLIPAEVSSELTRLKPQKIVVVGGPASVSDAVYTALSAFAPSISRIGGATRYTVSQSLASSVFGAGGATKVFVATGRTFPDALSASAAAGSESVPVILIDGLEPKLDPELVSVLTQLGVKQIDIAGGPASVLPTVATALAAIPGVTGVTRYTGADRYQVSGALNRGEFGTATGVYVATGATFPDALAGAAVAGAQHAPLYIVEPSCIPSYDLDDFLKLKPTTMTILGGTGSLSSMIEEFAGC